MKNFSTVVLGHPSGESSARRRRTYNFGEGLGLLERRELLAAVAVSGLSNIYGAGLATPPSPGGGGGGILPVVVGLSTLGNPTSLDFPTVAGTVSARTVTGLYNGPDGGPYFGGSTNLRAVGGISGIHDDHATMFLVGVFLGPNGQPVTAPASVDVSKANSLTSFSPLLGQQFFIGDGRTGVGAIQKFAVPSGATRLFLGFADGYQFGNPDPRPGSYNDNGGSLKVDVQTGPTTADLYAGAAAAYGISAGTFSLPLGWKLLDASPSPELGDGFAAAAVRDPNGNLIILNEGTVPGTTTYDLGGLKADLGVGGVETPLALKDAAAFALAEQKLYGSLVYVAGHSLGGIEAEMECQALGANCGGGATFGATGLPGNVAPGPSTLVNYIDYGDPVGNSSTDPGSPLASLFAPFNMQHFGKTVMVGTPSDANALASGAASINNGLAGTDSWAFSPDFGGSASDAEVLAGLTELGLGVKDHLIPHYGTDLNLPIPKVTPADSIDVSLELYGISLGKAGFQNFQDAVVQPDGSLVSPDLTVAGDPANGVVVIRQTANISPRWGTALAGGLTTISSNPTTGLPTTFSYISPDHTDYAATFNSASETLQSLKADENNGGSYQISYDLSNTQPWSLNAVFYKGLNDTGAEIQLVDNWDAGGSQVQTFNNLPIGYSKRLSNYLGVNGTGKLISTVYVK